MWYVLGCLLYADDIILLSPWVTGLQEMLDRCYDMACSASLQFSTQSHCLLVGKTYKDAIRPIWPPRSMGDILPCF